MESLNGLAEKLYNFLRVVSENADTDVVLVAVAAGVVLLLLLVAALRTTLYRNLDRKDLVAVARRVEALEASAEALRGEVSRALKELSAMAEELRGGAEPDGGGGGGGGGTVPPSGGGSGDLGPAGPEGGRSSQPPASVAAPITAGPSGAPAEPAPEPAPMVRGLERSRSSFLGRLKGLFSGRKSIDAATLEELEELLVLSDVGARCAQALVERARQAAAETGSLEEGQLRELLKGGVRSELISVPDAHRMYSPTGALQVVLVVGVNGVGKTTTVAKLAARYKKQGKRVMVIAADTFRAAAVQQLEEWGSRIGFELVKGAENAKPGAVVFDGMAAAKGGGADVVLIDTAGRLHTKSNLMQELEGVRNSIRKHVPDAPHETILVLDGVSGQNALQQAREFNAAVPLTGIVVTKLDGTPKGGIVVAISQELKVPVLFVGVGERAEDLIPFNADQFVEALFQESGGGVPAASSWAGGGAAAPSSGAFLN